MPPNAAPRDTLVVRTEAEIRREHLKLNVEKLEAREEAFKVVEVHVEGYKSCAGGKKGVEEEVVAAR